MKPLEQNDPIAKLNELYITTRRKYLIQTPDTYITLNRDKNSSIWTLNDGMLKRHIEGTNTYGVFNGNMVNKFITFDVDYADDEASARWATLKLVDVLEREFRIYRNDIHVSISGGKGYHVDLFLDKALSIEAVKSFYTHVITSAELPSNKVEFRPTWTQGVKIPLGIHQRTGNRCWFVDNWTLTPIESFDYLNDVTPMDSDIILDANIELTPEQEADFAEIERRTDTTVNAVDATKALHNAARILEAGRLVESGSRHKTTLMLASFFNSQGIERDEAIEAIMTILYNTPVDYFSKDSTPDYWLKEAQRIVKIAFDRNYRLGNADMPITIFKSEIIAVLDVGTFRQKQLAYAMLITSKRYGGHSSVFYLTTTSAMQMIGTNSRDTVQNAVKQLVACGFMEYKRKGEKDVAKSRELGSPRNKPNKYRLLIAKPVEGEKSVEVTDKQTVVEVAYLLCDIGEIRHRVKRREYGSKWAQ